MAAPEIDRLLRFESPLTLFRANGGRFESELRQSGASVLVRTSGTAKMRFEVGEDWKFAVTGSQTQETDKPDVVAETTTLIEMLWSVSTALSDVVEMSVRVIVSMEGETTERVKTAVLQVQYVGTFSSFLHRMTRMFRR